MKDFFKNIATQAGAIILAALGAAIITFIQSIAIQTGACEAPINQVNEAGFLGAALKGLHSAYLAVHMRNIL